MSNTCSKKIFSALVLATLSFLGVPMSALANPLTNSTVLNGSGNSIDITFTTANLIVGNPAVVITLPSGMTLDQNAAILTNFTLTNCPPASVGFDSASVLRINCPGGNSVPAGSTAALSLDKSHILTYPTSSRTWGITTFDALTITDTASVIQSSGVAFNSNGGTGSMPTQWSSQATQLTSNTLTNPAGTFSGWNTAANGTGSAYANGDNYSFLNGATLYAQWTPTLAQTGFNVLAWGVPGIALVLLGIILVYRKHYWG